MRLFNWIQLSGLIFFSLLMVSTHSRAGICEDIVLNDGDHFGLSKTVLNPLGIKLRDLEHSTSPDLSIQHEKFLAEASSAHSFAKLREEELGEQLNDLKEDLRKFEDTYQKSFRPLSKFLTSIDLGSHSSAVRAKQKAIEELEEKVWTRRWLRVGLAKKLDRAEDLGAILTFTKYMRDADLIFDAHALRNLRPGATAVAVRYLVGSGYEIGKTIEDLSSLIAITSKYENRNDLPVEVALFLLSEGKYSEEDAAEFYRGVTSLLPVVRRTAAIRFAILFAKHRSPPLDRDVWIKLFLDMKRQDSSQEDNDLLYSISFAMNKLRSPMEAKRLIQYIREFSKSRLLSHTSATLLVNAFYWEKSPSELQTVSEQALVNRDSFRQSLKIDASGACLLAAGLASIEGNEQDRKELSSLYKRFFSIEGITESQAASIAVAIKVKDKFGPGFDPLLAMYFPDYKSSSYSSGAGYTSSSDTPIYGGFGGIDGNPGTPW